MKRLIALCALLVGTATARTGQAAAGKQQVLDLLQAGSSSTVVVPEGQDLDIVLESVAPAAVYRVLFTTTAPAQTQSLDLTKPFDQGFSNFKPSASCADMKEAGLAVLAAEDEAQAAARARDLRAKTAASACAENEKFMLKLVAAMTRRPLRQIHRLTPGQEMKVTIERLSGPGGPAVRTWTATFRGGAPDVGWAFADEQTWIVHEIAQDILEMAQFANGSSRSPSAAVSVKAEPPATGQPVPRFRVEAGQLVQTVTLAPHVWAPEAYLALARALIAREGLKAAPGPGRSGGETSVLKALTDLRASVIETENLRVSSRLTAQMGDARGHEEAALVIGALALRESAREFSDTRQLLSRMAAHMTLARALRGTGPPGREGQIAELLLTTLVGRQVDALDRIARLKAAPAINAAEKAWLNALSMRNDGDWRILAAPAEATLLERLQYFAALANADSASRALETMPPRSMESVPDWGRAALATSFSVEEGHLFALAAIPLELQELGQVWRLSHPEDLPTDRLVAALATKPGRAIHVGEDGQAAVQVLDWGAWASAGARHIYSHVIVTDRFLRSQWGVREMADAFRERADEVLGSLPLYSLAAARSHGPGSAPAVCESFARLIRETPEAMTVDNWTLAYRWCGRVAPGVPNYASWFSPIVPTGTTLDVQHRLLAADIALRAGLPEIDAVRALAPYQGTILTAYLGRKYGSKPEPGAIVKEFGRMAEYQAGAMRKVLEEYAKDPAAYRAVLEKMCAFSADQCLALGDHLVATNAPEAAALAYQRAVDHALNRVAVSVNMGWLVNYYHDRGETAKALAVARMAAEVHSAGGLLTMARYQERLKHYDEAERHYKMYADRYDEDDELMEFYLRYQAKVGGEKFKSAAAAAMKKLFPQGLKKVALADLTQPVGGALITHPGEPGAAWGLSAGDVVVALDGYRVESHSQYAYIKTLSGDPKMRLIVWQKGQFNEVTGDRSHIMYFSREPWQPQLVVGATKRP